MAYFIGQEKRSSRSGRLTQYAMLKLGRDDDVTTEIIGKICQALECTSDDTEEQV